MALKRLVVLISGSGSNLQALIDAQGNTSGYEIVAVVSNKANVKGLSRAAVAGIATTVVDHTGYDSRENFDAALLAAVQTYQPDIIALAGFMRILTPIFVAPFAGKMLNIHPSLLPKYPGLHTHQRALDAGDSHAGCTVHFVTEALDGGPPAIQAAVTIDATDTATSLAAKVLSREHVIYPLAVQWLAQNRLQLVGSRAYLDGNALDPSGYAFTQ